jgi:hypothetical protein
MSTRPRRNANGGQPAHPTVWRVAPLTLLAVVLTALVLPSTSLAASAPRILSASTGTSNDEPSAAEVHLSLRPDGLETHYDLWLENEGAVKEVAEGDVSASHLEEHFTFILSSLLPEHTYTWSLEASNDDGTAFESHTFTTFPAPPPGCPDGCPVRDPPESVFNGPPTISGTPVEGDTLIEHHGSWSNGPTEYTYQWERCSSGGASCAAIAGATSQSYLLVSPDVGDMIRVKETAANDSGTGAPAFSATTAVVAAPPLPASSGGGQTSSGGEQPPSSGVQPASGGVMGAKVAVSAAEIKSLLLRLPAPSGKGAKITTLLRQGDYLLSFDAPLAGKLVISWYLVPKGARLARATPVLVAEGRRNFTSADTAKITMRLTAKGRALLLQATSLNLTAKSVFTPSAQAAVSELNTFTLRR